LFFDLHKPPVIVDEIQNAGELFEYIKDIVDEKKIKGQFYLTGSQSMKIDEKRNRQSGGSYRSYKNAWPVNA
jgi:predicted AAA+ superfamily ATPase